jgi:hypothetical protein
LKLLSLTEGQKIPKASLLLLVPLLQILSSTALEDCLAMGEEGPSRQQLALSLVEVLQKERHGDDSHTVMSSSISFPHPCIFCHILMKFLLQCKFTVLFIFVRQ